MATRKKLLSDDEDDDRLSPLLQTQRFTKSGTLGSSSAASKDFKTPPARNRTHDAPNLNLNLRKINDDDDSLNTSDDDDDLNTKTARSTSSGTTSQLTPKAKQRATFLKSDTQKPMPKPRLLDIDDERNVFGQTTLKPSPRQRTNKQSLTPREQEEQQNSSWVKNLTSEPKRNSPTDMFTSGDKSSQSRFNSSRLKDDEDDSDGSSPFKKTSKRNDFTKSRPDEHIATKTSDIKRHSPTDIFSHGDKSSQSRFNSSQLKDDDIVSDDESPLKKTPKRTDFTKSRHDEHTATKTSDIKRHSPTDAIFNSDKPQMRRDSSRLKGDELDSDDDSPLKKTSTRTNFTKSRHEEHGPPKISDIKRHSPTDAISNSDKSHMRRESSRSKDDEIDSDDENPLKKTTKRTDFTKSRHDEHGPPKISDIKRHSPTDTFLNSDKPQMRRDSSKQKAEDVGSSDEDRSEKLVKRTAYTKSGKSIHDEKSATQPSTKDTDWSNIRRQSSSSRPGSAGKNEVEPARRTSLCDDEKTIIPPATTTHQPQSRPTSAKSGTTRQQTQSAIDNVLAANMPPTDPLTSNNEALAASLQPPPATTSDLPPSSARLPPRSKPSGNTTASTTRGNNQKSKFKVPTRYKEITSRVDTGLAPTSSVDLTRSVERALQKALKTQTMTGTRPLSARTRQLSANSTSGDRQRRRSTSAYDHVQPRINTNRSINFDELNTSRGRADSSQSIVDSVYLEWAKAKEDEKKLEKQERQRLQEESLKRVDKNTLERKAKQDAQNLERWRIEKAEQTKQQRLEARERRREEKEKKKRDEQEKRKNAKDGFDDWKVHKDDELKEKVEEHRQKKHEIEKQQEEKQKKILKAEEQYRRWMSKKDEQMKKTLVATKTARADELKKIGTKEESKFVSAQEAYENWLKDKEKFELEQNTLDRRRPSSAAKQQQVPFLPGGSQKNTGKIRHAVW